MLLAILSDSHDNLPNLHAALDYCAQAKIATLLHCGDLANAETLQAVVERFTGDVHLVAGNADYDVAAFQTLSTSRRHLHFYGDVGQLSTEAGKIAWCHHPQLARTLAATGRYIAVFYGHTHRPWEEAVGTCQLINPGTIAGTFHRPTFAVYDTAAAQAQLILVDQLHGLKYMR